MTIEDIQLKQGDAYLSNPNLKRANTTISWTQEQVIEFLKCKEDPVYFTKNYIKIVSTDEGLTNFNIWPFQERLISNFHKNRFNICKMPRQVGKALALDTPIPTPNGWTTIGDIKVGDKILAPDGKTTSVTFKTETMYDHKCYKMYFDNGEEIVADADHLWEVNSSYWRTGKKVINTEEIYQRYQKKNKNKRGKGVTGSFYIETTKPVDLEEDNLPIDPYLLGVWLGDGYSADGRIIAHKDDYEFYKTKIDIEHERQENNCIRFKVKGLKEKLKDLNLLKNKHIPQIYLRSSVEQRMELLRGLMDTDGSITKTQSFEFYQKNYEFVLQFVELISSLGIKSRMRRKLINNCYYYTISFASKDKIFNLPRKVELINFSQSSRPQNKRHYIQKIEETDSVPVACIQVDSDDHLFLCGKTFIPTHNTTTVVSYLLHYLVFNDHINIGILANKASTSREILSRLQLAYENLPKWMQQGVVSWNKGSVELENGSKILAASTSASAVRGMTFNIIFLDEFAFVPNHIADDFFASVYPTVSSGKSTKVIIVSTPKGMNHFYRMWHDAERGKSDFVATEVHWTEVPGRDEKWKEQIIANSSEEQFRAEYLCEFLGSVGTLVNPSKLKTLVYGDPLKKNKGLDIYEDPKPENNYVITVDVARGLDKDYSAFIVFDVTNFPYKVVAKYKNNQIKPMLFPSIIKEVADAYNKSWILVEVNDIGDQVANILHFDLEYDNILMCAMRGRAGQIVGTGFSGKKSQLGVRMTAAVKKLGCSNLKTLVEDDKLLVSDYDIISELTTFIQKHNSFEAEEGCNDDLAMCLVIFSWLVAQQYFKEMTENDVRKRIYEEQKNQIEQDMAPFGFISDGFDNDISVEEETGDRWLPFNSKEYSEYTEYFYDEFYNQSSTKDQGWEVKTWNLDEYGDMSYMWDYR
jgi:Terminase large subunit, T4likevirus-type, N-terminal/Terminase RNaseH-like domain/LAGLIDADG-like domain